jgi:hypothetical protein
MLTSDLKPNTTAVGQYPSKRQQREHAKVFELGEDSCCQQMEQ